MSDNLKEFYEALAGLQHEIGTIQKNKSVNIGKYKFSYADLASIREAIRDPMFKWGFSLTQVMEENILITSLNHKSGESIKSFAKIPPSPDLKALGASLTYLRRYSIASLLNLVSDDDIDAGAMEAEGEVLVRPEKKLSVDQIEELNIALGNCDREYIDKVMKGLKTAYGISNISQMPQDLYHRVLKAAQEHATS